MVIVSPLSPLIGVVGPLPNGRNLWHINCLGGGFNFFLLRLGDGVFIFNPNPGEMIQFDEHIFLMGGSTTNYTPEN